MDNETRESDGGSFLSMRGVSVARGDSVALHQLSLDIDLGEQLVLLGPNGCGKSTLLKTLTRELYPVAPRAGEPAARCRLLGREQWDLAQLRTQLGIVGAELPGQATLHATGLDAVLAGFFGASTLWPQHQVTPAMRSQASAALGQMRAQALRNKQVAAMSAGEQRRVMIARALVHQPTMLLLDEPSNALDLAAQRELRLALQELARQGTGLIMVTHQVGDILPEMGRVVLMDQGRIVADGPRTDLLREPVLSGLFGTEVRLGLHDGWVYAW